MSSLKPDYYIKERTVDHPVHRLIHERWSPVVFSDQAVEKEKLLTLFEAARWAPSCYNEQPWHFVVGFKGQESHERILPCLVEFNQKWAQHAPVLAISVVGTNFQKNDKPNRHAMHDVGLATGQLCLQAIDLELSVHQMAGFSVEKAREVLKIPQGYEPMAAIAIGYMADPTLSDNEKLTERDQTIGTRKPQEAFVFEGGWSVRPSLYP